MADASIFDILSAALTGTDLALANDAFGPGDVQDVLTEYFPGGTFTAQGVTLVQDGADVSFTRATAGGGPLEGMPIDASFTQGERVTMRVTATIGEGWTFDRGWPLLAGGWAPDLPFSSGAFELSSVADSAAGLVKGLSVSGAVAIGATWNAVSWLLGSAESIALSGPIGQTGDVPTFAFSARVGDTVHVPVLGDLTLEIVLSSAAVSGSVTPPGATFRRPLPPNKIGGVPVVSTWVPRTSFGVRTTLSLDDSTLPIFIDLASAGGLIDIDADVSQLRLVSLADFTKLIGVDLASALPPASSFDPGQYLTARSVGFALNPAARRLTSATIVVGSTRDWTVSSGVSVGPVDLSFTVGFGDATVMAALTGLVTYAGGSLQLGAFHPGFVFTGGLTPGSRVDLTALMDDLLPITIDAKLILDQLDFVVQPTTGSFSLATALVGDWSIPVGVASIDLTGAWLQLDRDGGTTSGAIGLTASLTPGGGGTPILFDGSWRVPGGFALSAAFPDIDLTSLASTLTGTTPPAGVPNIALTGSQIALRGDPRQDSYSFALASTAALNGGSLGTGVFVVRRTATATGFLVGFVIPMDWSPAAIWSNLSSLFGRLTFTNSGLLISTLPGGSAIDLPNLTMPSLPASIDPGFTFFTSLVLTGDILGPVSHLFGDDVSFDLRAVVDTAQPTASEIVARLGGAGGRNAIEFTGVEIILKPAAESVTLTAGATLAIQGERLQVKGSGSIAVGTSPTMSLTIEIDQWVQPFGIEGLTVDAFGLQVKVEEDGLTIGILGAFDVGAPGRSFTLVAGGELTEFEEPTAIFFCLEDDDPADPLMLSDLIHTFTSLDLASVPVLDEIGFKELTFWVVADPAGLTIAGHHFPTGVGIVADVVIYSWEAKFKLEVSWGKGIVAAGSINDPITLGDVFTLSDTTGTAGPSGSIDTTSLAAIERARRSGLQLLLLGDPPAYMTLDGRVALLGLTETVSARVSKSSFEFDLSFDFDGLATGALACRLIDDRNFAATAAFAFDLNVTVGPYAVEGVTLIPQVAIDGPDCAFALGVAVSPSVIAQLSVGLLFEWRSMSFDPAFTLSARAIGSDLANLYGSTIQWLKDNVDKLFSAILGDVEKWVDAVERVFTELGDDVDKVADALANYFGTTADDAAAYLKRLGFEVEEMVGALVRYFGMAADDAWRLVESLWDDCPMDTAFEDAGGPPVARLRPRDLGHALTAGPLGQQVLLVCHGHGPEVWRLLEAHPRLRMRVGNLLRRERGFHDPQLLIETGAAALAEIAHRASPPLRAEIDSLVPQLMHLRRSSWRELLRAIAR